MSHHHHLRSRITPSSSSSKLHSSTLKNSHRSFYLKSIDQVKSHQTYQIPKKGKLKITLDSKNLIGISQSRGERSYQEDRISISSLNIHINEIKQTLQSFKSQPELLNRFKTTKDLNSIEQTLCVGLFDGHGGSDSSEYLKSNLDQIIESCDPKSIPQVIRNYRTLGGYFRRFRGGYLEGLGEKMYANQNQSNPSESEHHSIKQAMELGERLTLAFLQADQHLISSAPESGSVGSLALIQSLPSQASSVIYPFYSSPLILLTIAHVGDTLALLCETQTGKVLPITETHHPESRVESERLRRIGTGLITDSFGESRWGGTLANTRGLGDSRFKKLGVTGEPDIVKKVLNGDEWAFMVMVSDGVSEVMSNQEIIDLCRNEFNPTSAAEAIVDFAEKLGG
ncbi:phosphatase 2C-like domain-containing protein [Melampsora americana]|nr:phosphatase 2C-like domain-containing protein [Melampsora americana]